MKNRVLRSNSLQTEMYSYLLKRIPVLVVVLLLTCNGAFGQQAVRIGIISDFEETDIRFSAFNDYILDEIAKTIGSKYAVQKNDSLLRSSGWNVEKASKQYRELSKHCDLILAIGANSLKGSQQNMPFVIPTIGLGVFHPELQSIPITTDQTSGTENFTYVLNSQDIQLELSDFKQRFDYEHLTIVLDQRTDQTINQNIMAERISQLKTLLDAEIAVIAVDTDNLDELSSTIPASTDAIYLAIPYEWNDEEAIKVCSIINEKKIPSLAMNAAYVEFGALMALSEKTHLDYITRKVAIMVDDALNEGDLDQFKVRAFKSNDIYINLNTAEKIGYSPDFQTLFTSRIIRTTPESVPLFSIEDIIHKSLEENLMIQISMKDIALSEKDLSLAKSQYLPAANADLTGLVIDEYRSNPLLGQAQRSILGTGTAQQLLYSEAVIAQMKIRKILLEAQKFATEQEILDQTLRCFQVYFSILQAKTNLAIKRENLRAFQANLELAEVRYRTGLNNNADVYRWESEVIRAKQALIESEADLLLAKLQLNALLNNSIEGEFDILDVSLNDNIFRLFANSSLSKSISSPASFELLTDFLVTEAQTNYPAKKQLLSNMTALERQITMNKRLFFAPTVAISGQIDQNFYRGGLGSEPLPGQVFYNTSWNAGVILSYPIFDGYRRKINLDKSRIQQEQLQYQMNHLEVSIALNVQKNTLNVLTSKTQIGNSENVAVNAEKNFEIVQNNYKSGTVSITQLIDAQQAMISAKQTYSLSIYNYMINFLTLENSIGMYSLLLSESEQSEFENRFQTFKDNYE